MAVPVGRSGFSLIGKLSIGDNKLKPQSIEQIQQSVIFNTQYNQMKASNSKFQGFAYNIIAESLRTWSQKSQFIKEKLEQKLSKDEKELDTMDLRIAEVYFNKLTNSSSEVDIADCQAECKGGSVPGSGTVGAVSGPGGVDTVT